MKCWVKENNMPEQARRTKSENNAKCPGSEALLRPENRKQTD